MSLLNTAQDHLTWVEVPASRPSIQPSLTNQKIFHEGTGDDAHQHLFKQLPNVGKL